MLTKRELLDAIKELEESTPTYEKCKKLVTFYTLYDYMYGEPKTEERVEKVVGAYGESEFMRVIEGKELRYVMGVMDELMSTLNVLNPNLYQGVLVKLAE